MVRSEMKGVCNVIIPSYTADLRGLNEAGISHDVRRNIELGFRGTLLVSETALTTDEYVRFVEVAVDEAAGEQVLFFHASFNTLEENIEQAKRAEDAGAEMVLLSYPPSFYPSSLRDVYDYTAAFCAGTSMAVMLFPVPLRGFERLHPAGIPIEMLEQMVRDIVERQGSHRHGGFVGPGVATSGPPTARGGRRPRPPWPAQRVWPPG
ncbi:dihydrodipicolinate synthase family protein [Pseudonocardia sp. RS010]|uniref:dihydrodipicolinate synthase family protein n=1 Tax=Pseudonocardia sp. RS010 TaxID=3385979 RepID=UPI0039A3F3EC